MDAQDVMRDAQTHFTAHVLTDLTLSLLQDSNWCCSLSFTAAPASVVFCLRARGCFLFVLVPECGRVSPFGSVSLPQLHW